MADEPDSIVLDILKQVQEGLGRVERKVDEGNARLIAMDGHMASFHTTQAVQSGGLAELQLRVDRLEKRLGLYDPSAEDDSPTD